MRHLKIDVNHMFNRHPAYFTVNNRSYIFRHGQTCWSFIVLNLKDIINMCTRCN